MSGLHDIRAAERLVLGDQVQNRSDDPLDLSGYSSDYGNIQRAIPKRPGSRFELFASTSQESQAMTPPDRIPLLEMTLRQLRRVASAVGVSRYSRMRKDQLLDAIQLKGPESESVEGLGSMATLVRPELADVDMGLMDLPSGYGASQIMLLPRDPQWAYAYWDVPQEKREEIRAQGGQQLALRLFDVTGLDLGRQAAHNVQEYGCDEMAREWYLPIPVSDRDYVLEIGYRAVDGRWLVMARSNSIRVPPVYPSEWIEDQFVTVTWNRELRGTQVMELVSPDERMALVEAGQPDAIHAQMQQLAAQAETMRVSGSLMGEAGADSVPGSIQHLESVSSMCSLRAWACGRFPTCRV
jgi:uncharacterized protein